MEKVNIVHEKLFKICFTLSSFLLVIFCPSGDNDECSPRAKNFLNFLFEMIALGKSTLDNALLWDGFENIGETSSPMFNAFETGIQRMVSDPRSSLLRLSFVDNAHRLNDSMEINISKAALHHASRFEKMCVFFADNNQDKVSKLVKAAVQTREKRKTAVLVCCVLRACEGAPHFMDVMMQIAAFVGELDHPIIPKSMTL